MKETTNKPIHNFKGLSSPVVANLCPLSKFYAIRDRSKIIEPLSESYPQVLVTTSLNGFTSYLLAIVWLTLLLYNLLLVIMLV